MPEPRPPMAFPDWAGFGPKMLALRERERKFVWAYLMNSLTDGRPNAAQSARDAGYSDIAEGAKVRGHDLLHRESVLEAMNECAARELRGLVVPAVVALARLVHKPDHQDHRAAIQMVLDRTGHGAKTSVDVNVNGTVNVNHTTAALEDLRRLMALGASRDKLLEIFGHSGLPRYEKMLAADGAKLIEHE